MDGLRHDGHLFVCFCCCFASLVSLWEHFKSLSMFCVSSISFCITGVSVVTLCVFVVIVSAFVVALCLCGVIWRLFPSLCGCLQRFVSLCFWDGPIQASLYVPLPNTELSYFTYSELRSQTHSVIWPFAAAKTQLRKRPRVTVSRFKANASSWTKLELFFNPCLSTKTTGLLLPYLIIRRLLFFLHLLISFLQSFLPSVCVIS